MRERDRNNGRTGVLVRPRYMVWENVPGAFSSNGGKDFQAVLSEIVKIAEPKSPDVPMPGKGGWPKSGCLYDEMGGWSVAWRVHDAQFWGVPQRRKRIALVADFGGLSAPEILFERKGLSGDFEPCGEAGQETAGAAGEGVEGASCYGLDHVVVYGISSYDSNAMKPTNLHSGIYEADTARTLDLNGGNPACNQGGIAVVQSIGFTNRGYYTGDVTETLRSDPHGAYPCVRVDVYNQEVTGEVAASLTAASGGTNTSGPKVIAAGFSFGQSAKARSIGFEEEVSPTLRGGEGGNQKPCVLAYGFEPGAAKRLDTENRFVREKTPTLRADMGDNQTSVLCLNDQGGSVMGVSEDVTGALRAEEHGHQPVLIASVYGVSSFGAYKEGTTSLRAQGGDNGGGSENIAVQNATVRRLTPLECERLQGFPDGWTDIGDWTDTNGKKHKAADSPRYQALGNSIALPFWKQLARRICAQYERDITMGSLFDGIGGFPLAFEHCGAKAVWASEIEEFCIAVTKRRFPEEEQT